MNDVIGGLKHILYIYAHPFDGFWIMKREKKGNLKTAILLLVLFVITTTYRIIATNYLFASSTASRFSAWLLLFLVLAAVALYCVANWALTTLFNGSGSMKDIFIALMYAVTPVIFLNIPITLLSHILVLNEVGFLSFFSYLGIIWSLFLLLVGNYSVHEYTMLKSIATLIGTVIAMVAIAVLVILSGNLVQQLYLWVKSVIQEILFRL